MSEVIYLDITKKDGGKLLVGSWKPPGEKVDNFTQQQEIGWHIMLAIQQGAKAIRVILAEERMA